MTTMTLLDKFTAAHEAWDELRHDLLCRIDDSVCNEVALQQLLSESGTIYDLIEQWGKRLEDELDEWNLERR